MYLFSVGFKFAMRSVLSERIHLPYSPFLTPALTLVLVLKGWLKAPFTWKAIYFACSCKSKCLNCVLNHIQEIFLSIAQNRFYLYRYEDHRIRSRSIQWEYFTNNLIILTRSMFKESICRQPANIKSVGTSCVVSSNSLMWGWRAWLWP